MFPQHQPALEHAGGLPDAPAGRRKYLEYLAWLAEDEPARKKQRFAEMSKGWVIGGGEFAKALVRENRALTGQGRRLAAEVQEAREAVWQEELTVLLRKLRREPGELAQTGKSADWKLAAAAALKVRTTVTNRWLATTLHMGNLHEVSRKVGAWSRQPDPVSSLLRLGWRILDESRESSLTLDPGPRCRVVPCKGHRYEHSYRNINGFRPSFLERGTCQKPRPAPHSCAHRRPALLAVHRDY